MGAKLDEGIGMEECRVEREDKKSKAIKMK